MKVLPAFVKSGMDKILEVQLRTEKRILSTTALIIPRDEREAAELSIQMYESISRINKIQYKLFILKRNP